VNKIGSSRAAGSGAPLRQKLLSLHNQPLDFRQSGKAKLWKHWAYSRKEFPDLLPSDEQLNAEMISKLHVRIRSPSFNDY
jgi:hypothetical protein